MQEVGEIGFPAIYSIAHFLLTVRINPLLQVEHLIELESNMSLAAQAVHPDGHDTQLNFSVE